MKRKPGAEPHNVRPLFDELMAFHPKSFSHDFHHRENNLHLQFKFRNEHDAFSAVSMARTHLKERAHEKDVFMIQPGSQGRVLFRGESEKGNQFIRKLAELAEKHRLKKGTLRLSRNALLSIALNTKTQNMSRMASAIERTKTRYG